MKHLTPSEIVDVLEARASAGQVRHAERCEACRQQLEWIRSALQRTADADIPDLSPLFWEHFPARVQDRIAADATPSNEGWRRWISGRRAAAIGAAVAVAILAAGVLTAPDRKRVADVPESWQRQPHVAQEMPSLDEAWAAVRSAAENAHLEDVHDAGIVARPGTADGAIEALSEEERRQLLQLLEQELKHPGA